jgi:integrase
VVRALPQVGAVVPASEPPWWLVRFPAVVHEPSRAWLRDLAACDVSRGTLRSYGYDLLRWLRFLHVSGVAWERAERVHVRALVEFLREAPNPLRAGRSADAPGLGSLNPVTGKAYPGARYAPRTINHQLTVLHEFYSFAVDSDLGPLVNPVPVQRGRDGGRVHAHEGPLEPVRRLPRAAYRQRVPRTTPRSIPDDAADQLFAALTCHRDRALVAFYLSSGVRASELLGLRLERIDYGRRTITVVSKGSRSLDAVPASADAFVWLALYLAELGGPPAAEGPVWWTRRRPRRPLTYHAARAVLGRVNTMLGTNYSLHDLRHTAAARMAADDNFSLVEVQTILRHASISSTQIYLRPRLDDLVAKVAELHQRRAVAAVAGPAVPEGYDAGELNELLGLGQ